MCFRKQTVEEMNRRWSKEKPILKRREQIRMEREKILGQRTIITTTKKLMAFIVTNCTIIEIFTGYLMYKQLEVASITGMSVDMNPQTTLITAVVVEAFSFMIYCYKSMKENCVGGVIHDTAMVKVLEDDSKLAKG